jgi:acyl transferase domain-containing protein
MKDYLDSLEALSKKQLILMLARQRLKETQVTAVVGLGCRFPGGLDDPASFWDALLRGRVVADEAGGVPHDSTGRPRWNVQALDIAPLADVLSKAAYLRDVDLFDADRFGIAHDEAIHMDPQQRLLLTTAAEALEDAGLTERQHLRVGVFTGVSTVEYNFAALRNGLAAGRLSPYMGPGGALSGTAARVAVGLGLNGPAMTVDTACSSALVALHLANAALERQECDVAVVGACHLLLSPFTAGVFDKAGMLSPTGRSRPFTAGADGYIRGEGCGVLVLKRLRDAQADGDHTYALVRGSAVYQHGDRAHISTVPSMGQTRVIEQALTRAGVQPHEVQFVEAQANGSKIGGVIEAESLAAAYDRQSPDAPPLFVGSCKANLGYLETASGAASLIKAVMALRSGVIPGQPDFDRADPDIAWHRTSLRVPREATPWPASPRRLAGVSAFGFTGTNAHVLLEAAGDASPRAAVPSTKTTGSSYWSEGNVWS